jgi:hypothetical protein
MERLGFRELDQAFQVVRGWAVSEHRKVRYLTDLADSLGSANRQRFGAFVRGHLFLGCLTAVYGLLWSICMGWGAVFILVLPALYTPGMSLLYSQGRAVELRCRGLVRTLTGDGSWGRGVAAKLRLELTHALVSLFAPGVALLCNLFVYQGGRRDESVVGVVGLFIALGLAGSLAVVGLARLLFRDSFWRLVGITILAMAVGILLPALGW